MVVVDVRPISEIDCADVVLLRAAESFHPGTIDRFSTSESETWFAQVSTSQEVVPQVGGPGCLGSATPRDFLVCALR